MKDKYLLIITACFLFDLLPQKLHNFFIWCILVRFDFDKESCKIRSKKL